MVILLMVALSSYFCAGVFWPLRLSEKFVYAISIFIIQILFVILSAGHLGFLNRPAVLAAWGVLSAAVFLYAQHKQPVIQQMAVDRDRLMSGTRKIFREPNGSFFAFSIFLFGWLLASAYFFPPRAVDDIDYHLPMVWEHWFKGQITLVPPPIQPEFAFPQNADLFFLMPVILWGTTRWIDAVQLIFSVCGSVVLFALLRSWGVTLSRSFFIGLMFFWAPVIIFQNGSCNHDVIFCVTALIILYLCTRIIHTPSFGRIGLLCVLSAVFIGMKQTALVYLLAFMPILFLRRKEVLRWEFFAILVLAASLFCFVYFRNFLIFGNPFYPASEFFKGAAGGFFDGLLYKLDSFVSERQLGTLSHGFGLVFWSFAVPGIALTMVRLRKKIFKRWPLFYSAFLMPVFMLFLLLNPKWNIDWAPRYVLIMIPLGYLLLAKSSYLLSWRAFSLAAILTSMLAIFMIPFRWMPHHLVHIALQDRLKGDNFKEYHYLQYAGWYVKFTYFWVEPLELLTKDAGGLSCYVASDKDWLANMYGTRLQNRLWQTQDPRPDMPDCLIYEQLADPYDFPMDQIPMEYILASPEYSMIVAGPTSWFFIRNSLLEDSLRLRPLLDFYESFFTQQIESAREIYAELQDDRSPLVVTDALGNGFKYLSLSGEIPNPVHFIPSKMIPYHQQHIKLLDAIRIL